MKRSRFFADETYESPVDDESIEFDDEEKKSALGLDADFGELLGQGAYGYVYASASDPTIAYRASRHHNARGAAIHEFLSNAPNMGPCIPRFYGKEEIVNPKGLDKGVYEVVKMERATGSLREIGSTNKENLMFMLLWTYWVANANYGFMHRDLKLDNLVYKRLGRTKTFKFVIPNHGTWTIATDVVPMFIDFDFAALLTTRTIEKYGNGTYITAPPESLAYNLVMPERTSTVYGNEHYPEVGYDLWSLAVVWGSLGSRNHLMTVIHQELIHKVLKKHIKPSVANKDKWLALSQICLFKYARGDGLFPPVDLIDAVYSRNVFTYQFKEALKELRQQYNTNYLYAIKYTPHKLLDMMLDWNPQKRIPLNEPWFMFWLLIEPSDGPAEETYVQVRRPFMEFNRDEEFRRQRFEQLARVRYVEARVCDSCGGNEPRFVCSGCGATVCGEECH